MPIKLDCGREPVWFYNNTGCEGGGYYVSRDVAELKCENEECDLNNAKQCAAPASVTLNPSGVCKLWIKLKEKT